MINRLIEPTNGRVLIDGEDVAGIGAVALRRRIGYVIQHVGLFPHQSIGANVGTVPKLLGWPRTRVQARVDELLDLVGLEPARYRDRYPAELSGGQRQRVGVARALAGDPVLLLMDEPFSAVDPIVRLRLQDEFLRLQRAVRKTIVLVTHDLDEAIRLGDRIAVLSDGGVLEQYATPADLLSRPANEFVARFIGADRGVKRLSVTPIDPAKLAPLASVDGAGSAPAVASTVTLRDALAALLDGGRDYVVVTGPGGAPTGVLTSRAIIEAATPDTAGR
jgi:osmoprotectant transport system ATP-binding protein